MVQFYCDTNYIRVPDTEIAICQVTGHWSKVVPACLKPGCQVIIIYMYVHGLLSPPTDPTNHRTLLRISRFAEKIANRQSERSSA